MKQILLLARNDGQYDEFRRYIKKNIPIEQCNTKNLGLDFWTEDYYITIRPNSENCYRGMRPDYHYAYGIKANVYLLSTGSKRLRSLDDVINLVKGK